MVVNRSAAKEHQPGNGGPAVNVGRVAGIRPMPSELVFIKERISCAIW
jgi:hypothetical protein